MMNMSPDEQKKEFIKISVNQRVQHHKHQITIRNELITGWKNLHIERRADAEANHELIRFLFVIFSRKNFDDFDKAETDLVVLKNKKKTPFMVKCLAEFDTKYEDEMVHRFVIQSVHRRLEYLRKEQISYELLCDLWVGLDLESNLVFQQLKVVFDARSEPVLVEFESAVLLNATMIYSPKLKYADNNGIKMPDGSIYNGLYTVLDSESYFQYCQFNYAFLELPLFVDLIKFMMLNFSLTTSGLTELTSMPEFERVFSNENLLLDFTREHAEPASSILEKKKYNLDTDRTIQIPALLVTGKLKPKIEQRLEKQSIISASMLAMESQLVSRSLPDTFLAEWDRLNLGGMNTVPTPGPSNVVESAPELDQPHESHGETSVTSPSSPSSNPALTFHIRYLDYCDDFDTKLLSKRDSYLAIRELLHNLVMITFHTKEYLLAARILPLLRQRITQEYFIMFLYFDTIKELPGSLSFLYFLLKSKRFDKKQ